MGTRLGGKSLPDQTTATFQSLFSAAMLPHCARRSVNASERPCTLFSNPARPQAQETCTTRWGEGQESSFATGQADRQGTCTLGACEDSPLKIPWSGETARSPRQFPLCRGSCSRQHVWVSVGVGSGATATTRGRTHGMASPAFPAHELLAAVGLAVEPGKEALRAPPSQATRLGF